MSFDIALTGLNAANEQLNTIGNNIANAGTVGFKSSRVDFGSLYADTQAMGVEVLGSTQSISHGGSLTTTNRSLDLAISGGGFFVTRTSGGDITYTRAGVFGVDKDNYVVNNMGQRLQGYPIDANKNIQTGTISDLHLQSASLPAEATTTLDFIANLDANHVAPAVPFDKDDVNSYNATYSSQVYDSLGREHTLTQYFVKGAVDNEWSVEYFIGGASAGAAHALVFYNIGMLSAGTNVTLNHAVGAGANDLNITFDYTGTSQYGSDFAVTTNRSSGYAAGEQTGMTVENDGKVYVSYSNGQRMLQGQVVLANFANPEGLKNISGTAWTETSASGAALFGMPGVGQLGGINAGTLENSNVDLTQQLVGLMEGQRNYQANTKVISTDKELTQILFNAI
jgi:flagellar hook protein FlgE